jgi:hypothetical protein
VNRDDVARGDVDGRAIAGRRRPVAAVVRDAERGVDTVDAQAGEDLRSDERLLIRQHDEIAGHAVDRNGRAVAILRAGGVGDGKGVGVVEHERLAGDEQRVGAGRRRGRECNGCRETEDSRGESGMSHGTSGLAARRDGGWFLASPYEPRRVISGDNGSFSPAGELAPWP